MVWMRWKRREYLRRSTNWTSGMESIVPSIHFTNSWTSSLLKHPSGPDKSSILRTFSWWSFVSCSFDSIERIWSDLLDENPTTGCEIFKVELWEPRVERFEGPNQIDEVRSQTWHYRRSYTSNSPHLGLFLHVAQKLLLNYSQKFLSSPELFWCL